MNSLKKKFRFLFCRANTSSKLFHLAFDNRKAEIRFSIRDGVLREGGHLAGPTLAAYYSFPGPEYSKYSMASSGPVGCKLE